LVDTLAPSATYMRGTLALNGVSIPDWGSYNPGTRVIRVTLGTVLPGDSGALTFSVKVGPPTISRAGVRNIASWTSQGIPVGVTAPVIHNVDPFDIVKSVKDLSNATKVRTGDVLQWTIAVTNRGIVPATHVVVTDRVPVGTTYVARSIQGPGADGGHNPNLSWHIGTIPVGGKVTVTFRSSVNKTIPNGTRISNQAIVTADQSRPKKSTAAGGKVDDPTTVVVLTSGNEGLTLGLVGLLIGLATGIAWWGRPRAGDGDRAARNIESKEMSRMEVRLARRASGRRGALRRTAALLVALALAAGGLEVAAAFGLPVPSPGEAIGALAGANASRQAAWSRSGRVVIPSLKVNVDLVEGAYYKTALRHGVWHQPPSAVPGQRAASVIAGHRVIAQFRKLVTVKPGARVNVVYRGRTYLYRVATVANVAATAPTASFRLGSSEKLILYTCLPKWRGDMRTVVTCYRVYR
jgi:LPXTG-site transpeptidase (sortase) family protein